MSLAGGDLTTPQRVGVWLASPPPPPSAILAQLITSMTAMIYSKLNRSRLYSQTFTRTFDGVGNMQLELPDWPVTSIISVQQGSALIPPSTLPVPNSSNTTGTSFGYGYRFVPWNGNLPGDPCVIELVNGFFYTAPQNVKVTYQAGYLISNEAATIPASLQVTVQQPQGIWCRDNGVTYADGSPLTPVASSPAAGQYIPPTDTQLGLYTFNVADENASVLISYSFIPADLEEACVQMVAERYSYRNRVGDLSKSLGGQETVRFLRGGGGGRAYGGVSSLPPEVIDLIWPYVSVVPPAIGAPV